LTTTPGRGSASFRPARGKRMFLWGICAAAALACTAAFAQQAYPSRPIKIIVAYTPGGANDVVARLMGQKLGEELGQSVVVENRPGAGGILGTEYVARAEPDGYTLLLGAGGAITINPSIYPTLPYRPQKDLEPISQVATSSLVAVVNPALPVRGMKDLLQYAGKQPQGITFASPGTGTPLHLAGEMLKGMSGIKMTHVPYKGSGPALTDLIGGQVDLMFDVIGTSLPHIRSGKLRAIGVTGPQRDKLLPDVPTLVEQGLKGFDVTVWYGLFAPARTPPDILRRLESAVIKIAAMPDVRDRLNTLALTPAAEGRAALAHRVNEEIPRWARIVKEAGVKVE
jgi:tripartite-type tricarboxylate transporter receptor subunit TctC